GSAPADLATAATAAEASSARAPRPAPIGIPVVSASNGQIRITDPSVTRTWAPARSTTPVRATAPVSTPASTPAPGRADPDPATSAKGRIRLGDGRYSVTLGLVIAAAIVTGLTAALLVSLIAKLFGGGL